MIINQKVSIIIPVYNVQDYLRCCLDSVFRQSYNNLEIIVINDGSTDGSRAICQEYLETNNMILINKENGGLSSARNVGLERCSGDYVFFLDSDDWLENDCIKILIDEIHYGYDIVCCACSEVVEDVKKPLLKHKDVEYTKLEALADLTGKQFILFEQVQQKLYKRKLFDELRFTEGRIHEDTFITIPLFGLAEKIKYIDKPLYNYRIRKGSITNSGYNLREFDRIEGYESNKKYIDLNFPELSNKIRERIVGAAVYNYINIFDKNVNREYKRKCELIFTEYYDLRKNFKMSINIFLVLFIKYRKILFMFLKIYYKVLNIKVKEVSN